MMGPSSTALPSFTACSREVMRCGEVRVSFLLLAGAAARVLFLDCFVERGAIVVMVVVTGVVRWREGYW
jgi:hypothetical protein